MLQSVFMTFRELQYSKHCH